MLIALPMLFYADWGRIQFGFRSAQSSIPSSCCSPFAAFETDSRLDLDPDRSGRRGQRAGIGVRNLGWWPSGLYGRSYRGDDQSKMTASGVRHVPVADPSRVAAVEHDALGSMFDRFLRAGRYIHGPQHAMFERELAKFLGVTHCAGVASGTDALEIALSAIGCGVGDEVVAAANCGGYASAAARKAGLRVRFAEVDEVTLLLGRNSCGRADAGVGGRRRHTSLRPHGRRRTDRGSLPSTRHHGGRGLRPGGRRVPKRAPRRLGWRCRDVQLLPDEESRRARRRRCCRDVRRRCRGARHPTAPVRMATKYSVTLAGGRTRGSTRSRRPCFGCGSRASTAGTGGGGRSLSDTPTPFLAGGRVVAGSGDAFVAHLAVAVVEDRERVRSILHDAGIGTDVHYPVADHLQPAWAVEYEGVRLPVTKRRQHVLTLPCFPELTDAEVDRVCEVLGGI